MADRTTPGTGFDSIFHGIHARAEAVGRERTLAGLRTDQRRRWLRGEPLSVEEYRECMPFLARDTETLLDLIYSEVLLREEFGECPTLDEYQQRFPDQSVALARQFEVHRLFDDSAFAAVDDDPSDDSTAVTNPTALRSEDSSVGADDLAAAAVPGYEILEELGRGGMGVVYKARQLSLNRIVALKMVLAGHHAGAPELVRFLAEAEAAAALQHPNIVQIHEIGRYRSLPYFSLEYCPGGALARSLDGTPQPPRPAAEFLEVLARAMQHAHERGIVHRDLKPANILLVDGGVAGSESSKTLVTPDATHQSPLTTHQPKIADFGLAKRVESGSDLTRTGAFLGTPSYMAPEQASGRSKDVGPAADIYALGAILYELLTGRPPFRGVDALATLELVRTAEPVPPRHLQPSVPRDLETIALKCLHKEPSRRYPSAVALADDLQRWLTNRPIVARPVSRAERAAKWVRRQPTMAALVLVSVSAVLAEVGGVLWHNSQLVQALETARVERARADESADKARSAARRAAEVRRILVGMFASADPLGLDSAGLGGSRGGGKPTNAADLIARAEESLKTELLDAPEARAEVLDTIGDLARTLGDFPRADILLGEALRLRQTHLPPDHPDLAASLHHLGWLRSEQGEFDEAERLFRRALEIRVDQFGPEDPATLDTLLHRAWVAALRDDLDAAEWMFREHLDTRVRRGDGERDLAIARMGLAALYLERGDQIAAAPLLGLILPYIVKTAGAQSLDTAVCRFQQGALAQMNGRPQDAIAPLREARKIVRERLGARHLYESLVLFQLGLALDQTGELDEAEATYRECRAIAMERVGPAHPKLVVLTACFADLLRRRGKSNEAESLFLELIAKMTTACGGRFLGDALYAYGDFLSHLDRPADELSILRRALANFESHGAATRSNYARCLFELSDAYRRQGRPADAEKRLVQAVPLLRGRGGQDIPCARALTALAAVRRELGRTDDVPELLTEAQALLLKRSVFDLSRPFSKSPPPPLVLADTLVEWHRFHIGQGRVAEAAAAAREVARNWPGNAGKVYLSARLLAECSSATAAEGEDPFADEALAALKRAVVAGFRDGERLRADPAWKSLRLRAEYAAVLNLLKN